MGSPWVCSMDWRSVFCPSPLLNTNIFYLFTNIFFYLPIFFFSPDELLSQIKKPLNLPLHGGPKAFSPDENSVEDELLTSMLEEQKNVLKEQRIHKRYCFKYKHYLF